MVQKRTTAKKPLSDKEFEKLKRNAARTRAKRWADLYKSDLQLAKERQRLEEFNNLGVTPTEADEIIVPEPTPDIGWSWTFPIDRIKRFFGL